MTDKTTPHVFALPFVQYRRWSLLTHPSYRDIQYLRAVLSCPHTSSVFTNERIIYLVSITHATLRQYTCIFQIFSILFNRQLTSFAFCNLHTYRLFSETSIHVRILTALFPFIPFHPFKMPFVHVDSLD